MKKAILSPLPAPALVVLMGAIWSGCDTEPTFLTPNLEPNTRVSAGPPEKSDTGFTVNLFWFGWDDDGFVDHYEISWETPDQWEGPIFTSDSLFTLEAAETCCVEPLPDHGIDLPDSVYEQFHTFFVRAVDDNGDPDPTPAFRSFNSKTVAPFTEITFGPSESGRWGTNVEFRWAGDDVDGVVVAYRAGLVSLEEWRFDHPGQDLPNNQEFVAWFDTLTFRPLATGGYGDSLVWRFTEETSVIYPELPTTDPESPEDLPNLYLFGVRAIDDAGAEERILDLGPNVRRFRVSKLLNGPRIRLASNIAGTWRTGDPIEIREVFAGDGIRFEWSATPGQSGAPVGGFSYAVDDTADWTPFSLNSIEWPQRVEGEDRFWFPDSRPHAFFLRAIDLSGFIQVLAAKLQIFDGPRFCEESMRTILVVLDTDPGSLEENGVLPLDYDIIERRLVDYWLDGYDYQVFETEGLFEVDVSLLNCASSTIWIVSGATDEGDQSVLESYHSDPPNPLPSYVSSGGNIFLCGVQPATTLRYFDRIDEAPQIQRFPVIFQNTLTDTTVAPHWATTHFGISRINETVGNTNATSSAPLRLRKATSQVPEYPDLAFDPLTWPEGPLRRGFGHYDRDVIPVEGAAEVIYTFNDTDIPIAVRRLTAPGVNSNTVYLGLHPYFVERPAFRALVQAVLTDFGEFRRNP